MFAYCEEPSCIYVTVDTVSLSDLVLVVKKAGGKLKVGHNGYTSQCPVCKKDSLRID